jgi:hypothetical protein
MSNKLSIQVLTECLGPNSGKKGRYGGRYRQKTAGCKAKQMACFVVVGGTGIEPVTPAV